MSLIIAGLGWSGSSAVIDFLFDQGIVRGFYIDYPDETTILHSTVINILLDLHTKYGVNDYNAYDFAFLMSGGRYGLDKARNKEYFSDNIINIIRKNKKILLEEQFLVNVIKSEFQDEYIKFHEIKVKYIAVVKKLCLDLETSNDKIILFNNDAHAYNNDSFFELNDYLKIIVYRNPLDQFTDRVILRKYKNYHLKRTRVLLAFAIVNNVRLIKSFIFSIIDKNTMYFTFEQFLDDPTFSVKIIKFISKKQNLQETKVSKRRFDKERSKGNINIHKGELSLYETLILNIFALPVYKIIFWINSRRLLYFSR